jgi:hypothetical protein
LDDLREFAEVDIHENDPRYRLPICCWQILATGCDFQSNLSAAAT